MYTCVTASFKIRMGTTSQTVIDCREPSLFSTTNPDRVRASGSNVEHQGSYIHRKPVLRAIHDK